MGIVGLIFRSKLLQFGISVCVLISIYCVYNIFDNSRFSTISEQYRHPKPADENILSVSKNNNTTVLKEYIDVLITFTKAENNNKLQQNFKTTVRSLFRWSTIPVNIHILGDDNSYHLAAGILTEVTAKQEYKITHLNVDKLAKQVHEIISEMQKYFSYKPGAYYSDSLFFMSLAIHRVLPDMHKVIMLDADLKFDADIKDLYSLFINFTDENIIGIATDSQPVYRHNFHMYRNAHKGTRVGGHPPDGLSGFNSGVVLLDLDKMRKSTVYNNLLSAESVRLLTEKYLFKGHLGDQDFFSLISLDHEELFYVLPCTWNRQLCQWWRDHGYSEVFDQYYKCEGHINIYHGNCGTPIPQLEWEIHGEIK